MFSYVQVQVVSCSLSVYRMRNVDTIVEFSFKMRSLGRRN